MEASKGAQKRYPMVTMASNIDQLAEWALTGFSGTRDGGKGEFVEAGCLSELNNKKPSLS